MVNVKKKTFKKRRYHENILSNRHYQLKIKINVKEPKANSAVEMYSNEMKILPKGFKRLD